MANAIVICGNPVDGFSFHGPFTDSEGAIEWAEGQSSGWWIAQLQSNTEQPKFNQPVMSVEVCLPDGAVAMWALLETDDKTIDRLTDAIESIIGKPDTITL